MTTHQTFSPLTQGNIAVRNKDYVTAIGHYIYAARNTPELAKMLSCNIRMAQRKYRNQRALIPRLRVAICSTLLADGMPGRIHAFTNFYNDFADIELIGISSQSSYSEEAERASSTSKPTRLLAILDDNDSINKAIDFIACSPFDSLHLFKPCARTLLIGTLYKIIWDAKVLIDIDDETFLPGESELAGVLDAYLQGNQAFPALSSSNTEEWLKISLSLAKEFDGITASSAAVQQRFGGELISHALEEKNILKLKRSIENTTSRSLSQAMAKLAGIFMPQLAQLVQEQKYPSLHHNLESGAHTQYRLESQPNSSNTATVELATSTLESPPTKFELSDYILEQINKLGLFDAEWYVEEHSLGISTEEALQHYLTQGIEQDLNPSDKFNTRFYKQSNPDIVSVGANPFIHYATQGINEGRRPLPLENIATASGTGSPQVSSAQLDGYTLEQINKLNLFDAEWYIKEYALNITIDEALDHYLIFGIEQELNPSSQFNTRHYKRSNPDVMNSGANPFIHYAVQGVNEGRLPLPLDLAQVSTEQKIIDQQYVPYRKVDSIEVEIPAKVICFYLPQFHAIPENDKWWGTGFTEWTNVKPAQPQFEGHYQPHEPDVLGYYNLLDTEVQRKQVELAKNYGVGGFCFYYYWFDGKRLLEKPVENYLNDKSLDLPFCLCWANENWSRRWDGLENDILMGQNHCPEDDLAFIESLAPYLKDSRYIRVDGKPLVIIYRPGLFPDPVGTGKFWRQWCRENGIGEIHLALTHSFEKTPPHEYGYDSVVEFPPNNTGIPNITAQIEGVNEDFAGSIYDWGTLVKRSEDYTTPEYPVFRGVCPSWDNTARKKKKGSILYGSSPRQYQNWLFNAIADTSKRWKGTDRLVFVNAWNEWAEGAHLEPDARYGFAYLEATRNALLKASLCLEQNKSSVDNDTLAVVVHSFYPDILEEIIERLKKTGNTQLKLFVTCPEDKASEVEGILARSGFEHLLLPTTNRGRDVLPFFKILPHILNGHHRAILKLHTKKSKHRDDGDKWRDDLYEKLIGHISAAQQAFKEDSEIGMIGPAGHILPMDSYWGSNEKNVLKLAARLGIGQEQVFDLPFIAGTMFFCRTISLLPLCKLATEDDFELEAGQTDGTFAHAIERIFPILMHSLKLTIMDTEHKKTEHTHSSGEYAYARKG
ncbi:glycoside hydrolase family 99-like domain-containing protein [Azotobacter beijerinckii]|uniref:Lipopolysaccharide biosynthesis protein n=1 Tax=Azotobacter beijerinckii TaxID=170623 RepID=A0A1I3ZTR3_9GAMM|nr:glycoside hydrolase family 99-like domain-containing protein [Azotobacter beijerinckii]SFA85686.1 Lipopolysaccharide biosynthesis protein [Azotobacter beijerinckii]SFK47512.1 Lipopolysaccharide biosynthesis protein [Azotobacter beijerinckii]